MIRSLWIAKTGLDAQQTQLDAISHNLANVGTNGFKRQHASFEDLLYQNMRQAGAQTSQQNTLPTGLQLGTGVKVVSTTRNYSQGSMNQTQNPFDLAIDGQGHFAVQLPDGQVGYTRDGAFRIDSQGQVVTKSGLPLVPAVTIPPNQSTVTIATDGVITVKSSNSSSPVQVGQLQITNFVNPPGLEPRGQNVFVETGSSGPPNTGNPGTNGLGSLQQGFLETSNVNVVEELVSMIQAQRAYEINSKAIQTSDQMLGRLSQL